MPVTRGFTHDPVARDPRLPPGQYDAGDEWPVLHAEATPSIRTDGWTFTVDGLVTTPTTWTWDEIHALPDSSYEGAIHCVTTWSKFDMAFDGVSVDALLKAAGPLDDVAFVLARSHSSNSATRETDPARR
jgi:DMSO/TMAO reductase YedYZ molybdopterin-dependent catalytic subunit